VTDIAASPAFPLQPAASAAPAQALPPGNRIEFTGARPEFVRLVMRGGCFELLTLGFYRFWLATDMRRHLWSNTSVNGDSLEYTGTAKELLIGFLFALAILVPIYLVYFFIGLEAERYQAFASVPLALFFFLFYQFAMYRARRYRLSRTIWRGLRFWMTGSGWSYAWRSGLWTLLVIVTLGLALPWYQAALERYKMKHSHFGDLQGRFDGTGWDFFKRGSWIWFLGLVAILLMIAFAVMSATPQLVPGLSEEHVRLIGGAGLVFLNLGVMVGAPFAYAAYKAIEWRWWASGIRFGEVRFESTLRLSELVPLYWMVIAWSAFIGLFLTGWFGGVIYTAWLTMGPAQSSIEGFALAVTGIPLLVAMALGYLIAALAFGVVIRIYLRRDIWARVAASTTVHNLHVAENVAARGEAAGALGEGFADSLDIAGI
jgi:uncharacterized membrane protein YjgN (DUF898 family)